MSPKLIECLNNLRDQMLKENIAEVSDQTEKAYIRVYLANLTNPEELERFESKEKRASKN